MKFSRIIIIIILLQETLLLRNLKYVRIDKINSKIV